MSLFSFYGTFNVVIGMVFLLFRPMQFFFLQQCFQCFCNNDISLYVLHCLCFHNILNVIIIMIFLVFVLFEFFFFFFIFIIYILAMMRSIKICLLIQFFHIIMQLQEFLILYSKVGNETLNCMGDFLASKNKKVVMQIIEKL